MNVNTTEIRNVYVNRTVIVNNNSHVAFNGGQGGMQARPTPQQESYMHEHHTPPVAAQEQQVHAARENRALFASNNHGRPAVAATAKPGEFSGRGVVAAKAAGAPYHPPKMSPKEARAPAPAGNHAAENRPAENPALPRRRPILQPLMPGAMRRSPKIRPARKRAIPPKPTQRNPPPHRPRMLQTLRAKKARLTKLRRARKAHQKLRSPTRPSRMRPANQRQKRTRLLPKRVHQKQRRLVQLRKRTRPASRRQKRTRPRPKKARQKQRSLVPLPKRTPPANQLPSRELTRARQKKALLRRVLRGRAHRNRPTALRLPSRKNRPLRRNAKVLLPKKSTREARPISG